MNLQQLFRFFSFSVEKLEKSEKIDPQTEISGLFLDSRLVKPGAVFFAVKGTARDGHNSIPEAIANGAIAIVCTDVTKIPETFGGLVLQVQDVRSLVATLAARFFSTPSQDLFVIGVTGTNGKTSITYLVEHLLNFGALPAGVMGTINHHFRERIWPTEVTTPNAIDLQSRLAEFKNGGAKAAVMEVSSHALDQKRADSVSFDVAIFTNLTRDHLDYHKSMDEYLLAKQRLFTDLMWKTSKTSNAAIVNTDDIYGRMLKVAEPTHVWTYGKSFADFQFRIKSFDWSGTEFQLKTPLGIYDVKSLLLGDHNVYNVVASIVAAWVAGMTLESAIEALKTFSGIPGRLQKVNSQRVNIFVDYAHTPDALEKVLTILNDLRAKISPTAKIWCVFGCGGDRDKGKRPLMAQIAARLADKIILTSDNPRTEDPESILNDIEVGIPIEKKGRVSREVDRQKAITQALTGAKKGDVILIAGKGHEDYQIVGTTKLNFDDYKLASQVEKGMS